MDFDIEFDVPPDFFGGIDPIQIIMEEPELKDIAIARNGDCDPSSHLMVSNNDEYIGTLKDTTGVQYSQTGLFGKIKDPCYATNKADVVPINSTVYQSKEATKTAAQNIQLVSAAGLVPCTVCSKISKVTNSFGVDACGSCRAFFVRSTKDHAYKSFVCATAMCNCLVDSKSWLSCQKCRFDNCLKAGMKVPLRKKSISTCVSKVKQGPDRFFMLAQVTKSMKDLLLSPLASITLVEEIQLDQFSDKQIEMGNSSICKVMQSDLDILKQFLELYFQSRPFPLKTQKRMWDYVTYSGIQSAKDEDHNPWDNLCTSDRITLALNNIPLVSEFTMTKKLCKADDAKRDFCNIIKSLLSSADDTDYTCTVKKLINQVSKGGTLAPKRGSFDILYDREQFGLSRRHKKTALKLAKLGGYGPDEGWDKIHSILTMYVIFYTPDFLDLNKPQEVEKVQMFYASLLYRLV